MPSSPETRTPNPPNIKSAHQSHLAFNNINHQIDHSCALAGRFHQPCARRPSAISDTIICPQAVALDLYLTTIHGRQSCEIEKMGGWPLPPELTHLIFDHLDNHAACAAVSRQWQPLAETYAFSAIVVTSRRANDFHRLFRGGRRKYLRQITVKVASPRESIWVDLIATLHKFLNHLGQWKEGDIGYGKDLCLVLDGSRCGVPHSMSRPLDISDSPVSIVGTLKLECFEQICGVNEFGASKSELNLVQEIMRLTSRFPRLHTFASTAFGVRLNAWYSMVNALSSWPESLRRVQLSAFDMMGSWVREDLAEKRRTVSTKLARSSQQLSHLWVNGLAWDAFFADGKDLYWPRMERLTFCYDYATISSKIAKEKEPLLLTTSKGVNLNYEILDQMYGMAARAAMNMPQLRHLLMCAKREYTGPGHSHCIFYKVINGRGMLSWAKAETYNPSPKVIELWSAVARKHTRQDLIIQGVRGYPQFMEFDSPEHRSVWYDIPPSRLYVPKYWSNIPWDDEKKPWFVTYRSTEEEETELERREYSIAAGQSRAP